MQGHQEVDFSKKLDLSLWKRLYHIAKPFHKNMLLLMIANALLAGTDVIFPRLTGYAIDTFIVNSTSEGIGGFIAIYLGMVVLQVGCIGVFLLLASKIEIGISYLIRKLGFQKLQELPFSYYDRMPVGFLLSRLTTDTQRLADTLGWTVLDLMWGFFYLIFCSVQMLFLNWRLAIMVLLVVPPLAFISVFFQRRILKAHRETRKTHSKITGAFNEGIMGAKTTKTLACEEENIEEFTELTASMRKSAVRASSLSALFLSIVVSVGSIATAYALYKGGLDVMALPAGLTLGALQVFITYSMQLFDPIKEIARTLAEMQNAQAAGERVLSLLATEADIEDTPEVVEIFGDNFHPKKENWPELHGDIVFEDVSFQYKDGEKVLDHFSLTVKAGESIALVGETGSGKSTIINLICRFYEPTSGRILIDGVDYKERSLLWLQSHLGYVLQQPHMFSGTIRENICYGRPEATDEEVVRAAKLANAHDFISKLTIGYDTEVGEGGSLLSSGEKQLVSFARAILVDPALFILDEATSSVDTHSEALIQQAITGILEGRTSFMVAHRLSTVRQADRILVISDGKIIEEGNHDQLIVKQGYYYDLYTGQFEDEQGQAVLSSVMA
ncbi:MAG: ABC transporter ATP-binding protein [Clostridiales bacterium]|nr:ABC transporter ATP-binding protein [Clostridiales bacterium]